MAIKTAVYTSSSGTLQSCPPALFPEFAFIGRSNVGKSSLINMLTNNKKLAHVSKTPGKTQCINHFMINGLWYLVDLPGYGYAKVSKEKRGVFSQMIMDYLTKRKNMLMTFVLIDARLEPQQIDLDFINMLGEKNLPFAIAFTKADKIGRVKIEHNIGLFKNALRESWDDLPYLIITSATEQKGRDEIILFIENIISDAKES